MFCTDYVVVITTLGAEYSGEEILYLYRSRWQVELLFKRFKQNFSITVAKAGSKPYAEKMMLVQLIIWVIAERQALCVNVTGKKKQKKKKRYNLF